MSLRVVGAGSPRTGTSSLRAAIERLLGGKCCHMSALPNHPFDLGTEWRRALDGEVTNWDDVVGQYVGAVDWPSGLFWRELSAAYADSLVILSLRDPEEWFESFDEMVLHYARMCLGPHWHDRMDLVRLVEKFAGTTNWDNREVLIAAFERQNAEVRNSIPPERLLEWRVTEGWAPICDRLGVPIPDEPFPKIGAR